MLLPIAMPRPVRFAPADGQCGSLLSFLPGVRLVHDESCCAEARAAPASRPCQEASDCFAGCTDARVALAAGFSMRVPRPSSLFVHAG